VLSRKSATACFLGLFLLFSHVDLMFCHCVLLDSWIESVFVKIQFRNSFGIRKLKMETQRHNSESLGL